MSLGEKILKLRKKKGLSQEELGDKIKVTRQTISNWELDITSPNPDQLKKLSKELNASIDELLDNDIKNLIVEKVSNTEKVTITSLNILKIILGIIGIIIVIFIILVITKIIVKNTKDYGRRIEENIHCSIYGEEHGFGIEYYELTGEPIVLGGDAYFSDILDLDKYNDAHQIFNIINDYVKKNGGTCIRIRDDDLIESGIVDVSIKEGSLSKTGVTIIIKENVDYNLVYGESFVLQKLNPKTNKFEGMIEKPYCGFNDMAYYSTPDKPLEIRQDFSCLYGELSPGTYRLVKDAIFSLDHVDDNSNIFTIWVEFEID